MNKKISVKDICEFIWRLEEELCLFDQEIEGVYFWPLVRFQVYSEIVQKTKLFSAPHPSKVDTFMDVASRFSKIFEAFFIRNSLLVNLTGDFLFFPHNRQIHDNDIYLEFLLSKIPDKERVFIYENWRGKHYNKSINVYSMLFLIEFFEKVRSYINFISPSDQSSIIMMVENCIKLEYDIELKSLININNKIRVFKNKVKFFKRLYKDLKAKKVFVTVGYSHHAAIFAAQEMGIHVTELQHGIFTKFHLGYSFPVYNNNIPYFPNEVACFGHFWLENTPLPANIKKSVIGAPEILKSAVNLNKPGKIKNSILFTSQGVIGKYLFPFALECAKLLTGYFVTYRLHPSENLNTYMQIQRHLNSSSNFYISVDNPDIYSLLNVTEIQCGVCSTTLLEGMVLGCKTILINFPGIEYMEAVIARKDAILVNSPQEFVDSLSLAPVCNEPNYYYDTSSLDIDQFIKLD